MHSFPSDLLDKTVSVRLDETVFALGRSPCRRPNGRRTDITEGKEGLKGKGIVRFRVWHWHDAEDADTDSGGPRGGPYGAQREISTLGDPPNRRASQLDVKEASVVNLRA